MLEGLCFNGDVKTLSQVKDIIKGDIQKVLLHRAIEYNQVEVLKFLLNDCAQVTQNYNLLHIACR